ncbi:hypothetical protein HMPREF0183_2256 [Brevibacterium mcbrellneri ATCC 49030]|uniref:Uncharacterized protein n=1 Tax=Brevibacterium mcbrellneri ATCC 49030 TaxID=585530 RepID=D4YQP6_9MICO|nr:hypothetical protein HMPREF0183_2256 [Brevibacterium mcbrellneri ATCC 49030]
MIGTEPQRWGVIGFDHVGRSVELVVIHVPGGVFVIHANYLSKGFEQEMRNARRRNTLMSTASHLPTLTLNAGQTRLKPDSPTQR